MNAIERGKQIIDLRAACLAHAVRALRCGEAIDDVQTVYSELYRELAGDDLPGGAWERLAHHAHVCAAWAPSLWGSDD